MLKFRYDINLLRALAVIFVVLFHFKVPLINNGFAGVDVFFVISGYLMTAIIFRDFGNSLSWHKIIKTFYVRRFNRIVPALLLVLIFLLIFSFYSGFANIYKRIIEETLYAVEFISNIRYYRHIGYFDIEASRKWLLHTWSLSVEMQFYIFYPLVLIITKKLLGIYRIKWIVLLLFIASLFSSIYYAKIEPSHAYYLLDTRAWQLLAGGVVFLFPLKFKSQNTKMVQYLAVLLLIIFVLLPSFESDWMGIITVVPIILAMLLLYSNSSTTLSRNVVLKYLGLWSYSLYLWHWVIVAYLHYLQVLDLWYMKLFGIAVSVLFSAISYYTVERKFRYKTLVVFVAFIAIIVATNVLHKSKFIPSNSKSISFKVGSSLKYANFNKINSDTKYIFFGNSHTMMLEKMIDYLAQEHNVKIAIVYKFFSKHKSDSLWKYLQKHSDSAKSKIIFVARRWELEKISFKNDDFENMIKYLSSRYNKVVVMLQVPRQNHNAEYIYLKSFDYKANNINVDKLYQNSISLNEYKKRQKKINIAIYNVAKKYNNVVVIDPTPYLCYKYRCPVGTSKTSYYGDDDHLSSSGAMKLLPLFEPFFKETKKNNLITKQKKIRKD